MKRQGITIPITYIGWHHSVLRRHSHRWPHVHGSRGWPRARPRDGSHRNIAGPTGRLGAILLCFYRAAGRRRRCGRCGLVFVWLLLHGATTSSFPPTPDIYNIHFICCFISESMTLSHIFFHWCFTSVDNISAIVFAHGDITPLIGPPYWITTHGLYPTLPCKTAKFRN